MKDSHIKYEPLYCEVCDGSIVMPHDAETGVFRTVSGSVVRRDGSLGNHVTVTYAVCRACLHREQSVHS